ncbi:hypothetical protein ABE10_01320, partial [Bacillus toyonensis]|nr:hypothetical protein [Bacillus toyonensis]
QRGRLDAHRQVLRDDRDVLAVLGEVHRDREDATVVVVQSDPARKHALVGVVQLDTKSAALADRNGEVQPPVLDPQLIEVAQRLSREEAELRVMTLGLQFADHDDREDDGVLGETEERVRIGQEHGRVEHIGAKLLIERGRRLGLGGDPVCCLVDGLCG